MSYYIQLNGLDGATPEQQADIVRTYRETFERVIGDPSQVVATWQALQAEIEMARESTLEPQMGGVSSRWDLATAMARRVALEQWPGNSDKAQFEFSLVH